MPINQKAFVRLAKADRSNPPFAVADLRNIQEEVPEPFGGFVAHNRSIKVIAQQGGQGLAGAFRRSWNQKRALWPLGRWHRNLAGYSQLR